MAQGVKPADDAAEIDRIIQEIEEMEKSIDDVPKPQHNSAATTQAPEAVSSPVSASAEQAESAEVAETTAPDTAPVATPDTAKVVPIRPVSGPLDAVEVRDIKEESMSQESLAESDAVPAPRGSLQFERSAETAGEGELAMKIGGCTSVNLEFSRAGVCVNLTCDDDGLTITTDNGAEFRVPFRQKAA